MDIREWVKAARQAGKLTQEALGAAIGVTKSNVSGWENGRHEPSYGQMQRIEELTGYPMPNSKWPFPLVDQARWMALPAEARGYVQKALNDAISECERAANRAAALSTPARIYTLPAVTGERKTALRLKAEPGKLIDITNGKEAAHAR